jgi:TM2 domain-containing membrane protein YozV
VDDDKFDFDRGTRPRMSALDFEQRFLDFAYQTDATLNAPRVAHALKIPIAEAADQLEELAAHDVLIREVDEDGSVYFRLPGRPRRPALVGASIKPDEQLRRYERHGSPSEAAAIVSLAVNAFFFPGLGSLIVGRTGPAIGQMILFLTGIPLSFVIIGLPLLAVAWLWAIITSLSAIAEARQAQEIQQLPPPYPP